MASRNTTQSEKLETSSDSTSETEKLYASLTGKRFIEGREMDAGNVSETEELLLRLERGNEGNLSKNSNTISDSTKEIPKLYTALVDEEFIGGREMVAGNVSETEGLQLRPEGGNDSNLDDATPKYTNTNQEYFCTAQKARKRKHTEEGLQAKFLRIAEQQENSLKLLAESSAANSEDMKKMAEAITIMGEGLDQFAEAVNSLAQAIIQF